MNSQERALLLEEETLFIRHSGEIPEVALHGSLCYLTEEADGPGLVLDDEELAVLREAVRDRYLEIILRDLEPANRDLRLYRGLARAAVNWRRLCEFCRRGNLTLNAPLERIAQALHEFLAGELDDVTSGRRRSCLNCCAEELAGFALALGLEPDALPAGWRELCVSEDRGQKT